jgi:hypothetical protein
MLHNSTWAPHCFGLPFMMKWWENEFILWNFNSIWLKILNDIACNSNWIQIHCIHEIQLKINEMQMVWWFAFDFHHSLLWCLEEKQVWKDTNLKSHLSMLKIILWQIFNFEIIQN